MYILILGEECRHNHPDFSQNFRTFQSGNDVLFRNFGAKYLKWISGVIQNQTGPLSYSVILADGHCVCRHVDHIISRVPDTNKSDFDDVPSHLYWNYFTAKHLTPCPYCPEQTSTMQTDQPLSELVVEECYKEH